MKTSTGRNANDLVVVVLVVVVVVSVTSRKRVYVHIATTHETATYKLKIARLKAASAIEGKRLELPPIAEPESCPQFPS